MMNLLSPWRDDWQIMARYYRFLGPFHGELLRFKTVWMGSVACQPLWMSVGANTEGFYMATTFPVLPSPSKYPPLLIPWHDIAMSREMVYQSSLLTFRIAKARGLTFQIEEKVGNRLSIQAGAVWPEIEGMRPFFSVELRAGPWRMLPRERLRLAPARPERPEANSQPAPGTGTGTAPPGRTTKSVAVRKGFVR